MARHRFVVVGTASEGPGLTSVYVSGRGLAKINADAGQFFLWRFLTRDGWWQAHPFSLSAAPNGRWFRMTAKALGDHSAGLATLRPGTKVLLEGPFGNFTTRWRRGRKLLMIGAGVGITPLRAMFEEASTATGDVTLLYRASDSDGLGLRGELDEIAQRRGASVHYLVGPRDEHPEYLSPDHLQGLVRDIVQRDVYVCGPPGFTATVNSSLRTLRVPRRHIHTEMFEL
jgi:ferredoxin-NADP reductase